MNRTRNAGRNMLFGFLLNLYRVLIPFVVRTVMIWKLGEAYTGLNGLFSSLLQLLSLAELGVGAAMVYSMYRPVAEGDQARICAILSLYRSYYRWVGLVILGLGAALTPALPRMIHEGLPDDLNVYILYLLSLISTVVSYWLFAYKTSLLTVHQRTDIASKLEIVSKTVQVILQLYVLIVLENYYLFLAAEILSKIILNLMTGWLTSRLYPTCRPAGRLAEEEEKEVKLRIRDLFSSRFAAKVTEEADTIVISAFLGLLVLARYQNYFLLMAAVIRFFEVIFSSVMSGLGNSLILEEEEKNYQNLRIFTFLFLWLLAFASPCFLCLYQPFIRLWLGEGFLMPMTLVFCLTIYFFVYEVNRLLNTFKDAAGLWRVDKWRPLTAALVNILLNLLTVRTWGLYGVILSTVAAFALVEIPWLLVNLFRYLFMPCQKGPYTRELLGYMGTSLAAVLACGLVCRFMFSFLTHPLLQLPAGLLVCILVPAVAYTGVYHRRKIFWDSLAYLVRLLLGRVK